MCVYRFLSVCLWLFIFVYITERNKDVHETICMHVCCLCMPSKSCPWVSHINKPLYSLFFHTSLSTFRLKIGLSHMCSLGIFIDGSITYAWNTSCFNSCCSSLISIFWGTTVLKILSVINPSYKFYTIALHFVYIVFYTIYEYIISAYNTHIFIYLFMGTYVHIYMYTYISIMLIYLFCCIKDIWHEIYTLNIFLVFYSMSIQS